MARVGAFRALALLWGCGIGLVSGCETSGNSRLISSNGRPTFEEFEQTVYQEPWRGGVYIVDGDTPITNKAELRAFYDRHVSQPGALIVHQENGVDASWSDTQRKQLTYCVSDTFGENKQKMIDALHAATEGGWELYGDVNFVHVASEDGNCTAENENVVFDVRPVSSQPYLARAFFPNDPRSSRNVLVDTSSFDPSLEWPLSGILGHELGHSLGFRHEHTRPESGASFCFEDNEWRALTEYDSTSIMHYPQCNGTGTPLTYAATDKTGVAILYGPAGPAVCGDSFCSGDETCTSCEADCGKCPVCGDGSCTGNETCDDCPGDCGACPECGDGTCNGNENCSTCTGDCGECVCAHAICEEGPKLDSICDPCVTQICAADSYCCNVEWDNICVEEVTSICGQTCPAGA